MKKLLLLAVAIIVIQSLAAQSYPKYDNTWIVGESGTSYSLMTFDSDIPKVYEVKKFAFPFDNCNITISDSIGNLLFFSNGLQIANKKFEIMDGGSRINPSKFLDQYLESGAFRQILLAVPSVASKNKFLIFHQDVVFKDMPQSNIYSDAIYYSIIDQNSNNELGKVTEANVPIRKNIFSIGNLTATKHGNGLDWWIPVQGQDNNIYFIFKVDKDGAAFSHTQTIGSDIYHPFGQAVFSPDGEYYARVDARKIGEKTFVDVFKFDRCKGVFSNFRNILLEDTLKALNVCGAAISPNSRFLYITYQKYVFQFDLLADDLAASKDTVATYDGFKDPTHLNWPTYFWIPQVAPNGKIYINTGNYATSYLHVIDNPDAKGKSCMVQQHKIQLPTGNGFTMPYFPNYRLGPLKGSPCDTLSVATKEFAPTDYGLKVFPNPASDRIQIDITLPHYDPATKTEVVIVDFSGEIVHKYTSPDYAYLATIDISKLASGVYGVQLRQRNRVLAVEKLVVVR